MTAKKKPTTTDGFYTKPERLSIWFGNDEAPLASVNYNKHREEVEVSIDEPVAIRPDEIRQFLQAILDAAEQVTP